MDKPQVVAPIVVVVHPGALEIHTATEQAQTWVEQNAPEFGSLKPYYGKKAMQLQVSPLYRRHEVAHYIERMGGLVPEAVEQEVAPVEESAA
jgi:hypothetical protein